MGIFFSQVTATPDQNIDYYSKDAFNVYWKGQIIPDASVFTFQDLGNGYAKDSFNVYYKGKTIPGASPFNFVVPGRTTNQPVFNMGNKKTVRSPKIKRSPKNKRSPSPKRIKRKIKSPRRK